MEQLKKSYEQIIKTRNSEEINDFLIELSKNPKREHLDFLEFFITNLEPPILAKIKLNLIFILGEIGKYNPLKHEFLDFLIDNYHASDRWIRNEIIQTIGKISEHTKITENIVKLIGYVINDEYAPIKKNALKVMLNLEELPNLKGLLQILNSNDDEIVEIGIKVLAKFIPSSILLYNSLNSSDNYQYLKIKAIRTILLTFFKSVFDVESFKEKVLNSTWENDYKERYLKEIEVYERILLTKI